MDLEEISHNLINKGYQVHIFNTKEEASQYLNQEIDGSRVGIGGSVSAREMSLYDTLSIHNIVYSHEYPIEGLNDENLRLLASQSPIYISSVNAISKNGEIVNIDYTGNRVSAISYGPKVVYFIVGENKITEDLNSAIYRARNVAAPLNARRLHKNTPCSKLADHCYDCNSKDRICRNFSILIIKPKGIEYNILLIQEKLGY